MEYSAEDKIEIARLDLLTFDCGKWVFFGILVLSLDPTPTKALKTCCATNGKQLFYNPEEIDKLTIEQVRGVIAHETLHAAFGHMSGHRYNRTGNRNPERWNIACDLIVNEVVERSGLELPPYGIRVKDVPLTPPLQDDVLEYTAEQLYERIPFQPEEQFLCGLMDPASGDGGQNGDGEGQGVPAAMTDVERQLWAARLKAALDAARRAGKDPGNLETIIDDLFKPQVDWKRELHQFVQLHFEDETFIPPSRRQFAIAEQMREQLGENFSIVLPSMNEGEILRDLIIAVDSSGSISDEELKEFISEVYGIAVVGANIHLVYCDAAIQGWHELTPNPKMPNASGRGGTSFKPVFKEIEERGLFCQAVVYFTDGYPNDGWPKKPHYPVVWVVNNDEGLEAAKANAGYGRVIRYPKHSERTV